MKLLNKANIKQFISYFFVGGVAAIVEWVMFFIFANVLQINYFVSTVIAACVRSIRSACRYLAPPTA